MGFLIIFRALRPLAENKIFIFSFYGPFLLFSCFITWFKPIEFRVRNLIALTPVSDNINTDIHKLNCKIHFLNDMKIIIEFTKPLLYVDRYSYHLLSKFYDLIQLLLLHELRYGIALISVIFRFHQHLGWLPSIYQ